MMGERFHKDEVCSPDSFASRRFTTDLPPFMAVYRRLARGLGGWNYYFRTMD
jgi:hypothetical protein